jgi:hypothetical protein
LYTYFIFSQPSRLNPIRGELEKILDNKEKSNNSSSWKNSPTKKAIALWSYAATKSDELSLRKGDIIILTQTPEEGWWEGKVSNQVGWFPSPYCKIFEGSTPPEIDEEESEDPTEVAKVLIFINLKVKSFPCLL